MQFKKNQEVPFLRKHHFKHLLKTFFLNFTHFFRFQAHMWNQSLPQFLLHTFIYLTLFVTLKTTWNNLRRYL